MSPKVLTEDETFSAILAGSSIGRIGDGELAIAAGGSIKSQPAHPRLAEAMKAVLRESGNGKFLAGITRRDERSPKVHHANRCLGPRYTALYTAERYASAYISRPDCAPWINRADYWERVESLWRGRDVVLVRGSTKSLTPALLHSARSLTEIVAPRHDAFAVYDDLLTRLKREAADRPIILCLGPTATALALDLHDAGKHSLDLGHIGMFMRKFQRGEPAIVTEEDKAA